MDVVAADLGLERDNDFRWRIPRRGRMRVPGVIFASDELLPPLQDDQSLQQVANVATLPGVVAASYAMPDVHMGYGFPIGGVAATEADADGVVSPGGVGFDISCGVRLLASQVPVADVRTRIEQLISELSHRVPAGQGGHGVWRLRGRTDLEPVLEQGAGAAVAAGYGSEDDLMRCEDGGALPVPDPGAVSDRAAQRGRGQLGSLGSGNHFLEVQSVQEVLDEAAARAFGLERGTAAVMIHTGSRGLGHQICSDFVSRMLGTMAQHGIEVPDRQLASAPVRSREGQQYLSAMAAAANFGRANRQVLAEAVRNAFRTVFGSPPLRLVFDVSHNLAKVEEHVVDGRRMRLCVHRKGATLALPAGHPEVPEEYRLVGQPVLVPGSMGTSSYVLVGEPEGEAFHSTCHGSGRRMSRRQAMKGASGRALADRLREQGIHVSSRSLKALPEETPEAYKSADAVVRACAGAGLSRPVARLEPVGVLKG